MKFDYHNWKVEDQEITRLVKADFNNNYHDFIRAVVDDYSFEEQLEMFPYIKDYMKLRDMFLKAVENGEIKIVKTRWSEEYSTPSLKKWCKKVGKSKGYFRSYGLNYPERDYWMCINSFLKLNSTDNDFKAYARNKHWERLESFYNQEKSWYREHDEYSVVSDRVSKKLRELRLNLPRLNGWCDKIGDTVNGEEVWRSITLAEYRQLEKFADDYVTKRDEFIKNNFPF